MSERIQTRDLGVRDPATARLAFSSRPGDVVLQSGLGPIDIAEWSIYACHPECVFQVDGTRWSIQSSTSQPLATGVSPFDALSRLVRQTETDISSVLPFIGGWIGFIGYDVAPLLERLPRRVPKQSLIPDLQLSYYPAAVVHHRPTDRWTAVTRAKANSHLAGIQRLDMLERRLDQVCSFHDIGSPLIRGSVTSDLTRAEYETAIRRIKEYLVAGDIFQANFTQRFQARFRGSFETLVARAGCLAPAPFASILRAENWGIVSTSPERLFQLRPVRTERGQRYQVETRPIKGTRPRGATEADDAQAIQELLASPKDRAELTMIVDLERNDLGRVCEYGSVAVSRHAAVETYPNVHHLVSTVEGVVSPSHDRVAVIRALFPGGSITGAPKIRAMEIIDELEPCRRGVYTGAIGYLSDHGPADFNIAIRTLVLEGSSIHYHVGGGIVIDSDPEAEYAETLVKGSRLRDILTGRMTG